MLSEFFQQTQFILGGCCGIMSKVEWPFKDSKRTPFEDKYSNLAEKWTIDTNTVNYIIRLYAKKLEKALVQLEGKKIKLPKYFNDNRTDSEYIYDLMDGWLVEDIVCDVWLKSRLERIEPRVKIKHMGTNRDREIQFDNPSKITTKPDFVYLLPNGREVKVELQMARDLRTSFDMKESKIKRAINDGDTLYLWVLLSSDEYFFLLPSVFEHREPLPNPRWGGKKVYSISIDEIKRNGWGVYAIREEIPHNLHCLLLTSSEG